MARIRRWIPTLVIFAMSAVVVFPFLLLLRFESGTSFPQTPWHVVALLSLKSVILPMLASFVAALVALAIVATGYLCLGRVARRMVFMACAIPFLFPPVLTAHAIHVAFGRPSLLLTMTLVGLPFAVFGQAVALRFVDAPLLATG